MFQRSVVIWLVAWACAALAKFDASDAPYNYYSSGRLVPRPWFNQFESWYPHNAPKLVAISTGTCNLTLHDYRTAFAAPRNSANALKLLSICYRHEACIVDQLETNHLLNYQSALVMLGLVPTLMASIGPSIAEISLLYAHRPLLSALLSLGTSTLWTVSSLFEGNTPDRARVTRIDRLVPRGLGPRVAATMSAGEYLLAAGAAANAIFTALEIGQKTILSWGCTTQFTPLFWAVFPSVVYAIAGANYYFLIAKRTIGVTQSKHSLSIGYLLRHPFGTICRWLGREATICVNREGIRLGSKASVPKIARLLDICIGIMGFVHFCFGLAAFSSLQFVTVMDTFSKIICRFAISTFICRFILVVELAGIGLVDEGSPSSENKIVQGRDLGVEK